METEKSMTAQQADLTQRRAEMVERQLEARGIQDEAVLEAMRAVPREAFVAESLAEFAYRDAPLPIGEGQTISQPFMVALMAEMLELSPADRVLDVGTGSGYAAAVLATIAKEVYTVERHASLAEEARGRFRRLGYDNVHVRQGDGTLGWPARAPFEAIGAAAAGPEVPGPLLEQLAAHGRLVMPTGETGRMQKLVRVHRRSEGDYEREEMCGVRFVPLVGAAGFKEPDGGAFREGLLGRADFVYRGGGLRCASGARGQRAGGALGRGDPRHGRVLRDAGAHHPRTHRAQSLPGRRCRSRLARCRLGGPVRAKCAAQFLDRANSQGTVRALLRAALHALSNLDVGQRRNASVCRMAAAI